MNDQSHCQPAKRVAILGGGLSGRAAMDLLGAEGHLRRLFDERDGEDFTTVSKGEYHYGIISPGFPSRHLWRKHADDIGLPLVSEISMAAARWNAGDLVAITGTNGKTTLTEFLAFAFQQAGFAAVACGNNGQPLSKICLDWKKISSSKPRIAFCEVSSFQAHDLGSLQPGIALWTNFAEDHLNWHDDLAAYFEAKSRLLSAARIGILSMDVVKAADDYGFSLPEGLGVAADSLTVVPPASSVFAREPYCRLFSLALAVWRHYGLADELLCQAAAGFTMGPHRMEWIASIQGVDFINDSKATNFHAALAGARSLGQPVFWIGGGVEKGGRMADFVDAMIPSISAAFVYGKSAAQLAVLFQESNLPVEQYSTLDQAVFAAFRKAKSGTSILLSPAFASFDQFQDYQERGNYFRNTVLSLKKQAIAS